MSSAVQVENTGSRIVAKAAGADLVSKTFDPEFRAEGRDGARIEILATRKNAPTAPEALT